MNADIAFTPDRDTVLRLVEAAVLAPSADNRHHVLFELHEDGLAIHADPEYLCCRVAHRRLLILISFGAVVENLRLRLTEMGYTFEPDWFPDRHDASLVVRVRWADLTVARTVDPLAHHIEGRHTNRRFFKGPRLSDAEQRTIDAAVSPEAVVRLEWFDEPSRRRGLVRLMRIAETERFRSRVLHQELFESIDFTAGWRATTTDRLAPGALQVERGLRIPFAAFRRWPWMRVANRLGGHHAFGFRVGDLPARTAPHLGVLTSTLPIDEGALAAGTAFQRIWLTTESLGIALQPMIASAILAIYDDASQGVGKATFDALEDGWRTLVASARPLIVFRLGRAAPPGIRSGRRSVESYLR